MIHLACGTMYCWGNLISYLPPALKYWDGSTTSTGSPDALFVLPLILVSQMTGMPLGPVFEKQLGPRLTASIGALMMGLGVFLASYQTTLSGFVWLYSVIFGLGVGIAYQMPFITGARWFPDKKGMVTGAIISGMGASAFLFNILATKIINPDGANAIAGSFPAEIYARWPSLLRTLGLIYGGLAMTGALLQNNPSTFSGSYPLLDFLTGKKKQAPEPSKSKVGTPPPPSSSLASAVLSKDFGIMWLMILNSAVSGLNIAGSYKTFGAKQPLLNSDAYLSLVGSASAILGNAAGRFFWGSLSDSMGFKLPFTILTALQGITMLSYKALAASKITFALATITMLFCMGGNFAMFPAQTLRMYGPIGASVYSIMFTAFGSAALMGPIIGSKLMKSGGYDLVFRVLGLMSFVSLGLVQLT